MLALEDLKDMSEQDVKNHLAHQYSGEEKYDSATEDDIKKVADILAEYSILLAYESVGSWGCDSSSYFLLQHNTSGKLFEIHGGHCSCYGFEGQFDLEETSIEAIKARSDVFYCGGYDDNSTDNQREAKNFIASL